jgi:predicted P-loop ATPase
MATEKQTRPNRDDLDARDAGNGKNRKTWIDYIGAANSLGYNFALNDLDDAIEINGERKTKITESTILAHLHELNLPSVPLAKIAMDTEAARNRYHPIKKYLESLIWNGEDNIQKLCGYFVDTHDKITYLDGSQRSMFHVGLLRWLVGAIAKIYDPINAFNPVLILDGKQEKGKSYFVRWLCSDLPQYYFEGAIRPDQKDYLGYLATKFVWEVSEMASTINRSDKESLKDFISKREVTWRPSHEPYSLRKPALASMIGTVNFDGSLLNDPTGNRRFVPVEIVSIDRDYKDDLQIKQIWAQAYSLYRNGEPWVMCEEERREKLKITENYETENIYTSYILKWFTIEPGNEKIFMFTADIADRIKTFASLKLEDEALQKKIAESLRSLNLVRRQKGTNRLRAWLGIAPNDRKIIDT